MKIFEMIDEESRSFIGTLLYYDKSRTFVIELHDSLDEWTAPLLFSSYVKKKIYTIPRQASHLWVQERIIPSGRQNIQAILSTHKLREYDEMKFLELSHGRCSQDSIYIKKTDHLPDYVQERMKNNLRDCIICGQSSVLCFFQDGMIRKIDLAVFKGLNRSDDEDPVTDHVANITADKALERAVDKILKNRDIFLSGRISEGGYSLTFNDSIDIPATALYNAGTLIPLTPDDFFAFVRNNVLDTSQACELLECSRQNLAYMVKQEKIEIMKEEVKGNLYLKGDVLRNTW